MKAKNIKLINEIYKERYKYNLQDVGETYVWSASAYQLIISNIQILLTDFLRESTITVNVPFFDGTLEVEYGVRLNRRLNPDKTEGSQLYRNVTALSSRYSKVAGSDTNDSYTFVEDQPLFTTDYVVYSVKLPELLSDENFFGTNQHILGLLFHKITNEKWQTPDYITGILKTVVSQSTTHSYLTQAQSEELSKLIDAVEVATSVCNEVILQHETAIRKEREKEKRQYTRKTTVNNMVERYSSEPVDTAFQNEINASMEKIMEDLLLSRDGPYKPEFEEKWKDEAIKEIDETATPLDFSKNKQVIADVDSYMYNIFGFWYRNHKDEYVGAAKGFYEALEINPKSTFPFTEEQFNKLKCAKQFLRLVTVISSKLSYTYDYIDVKALDVGKLEADGTFTKDDTLLEYIDNTLKNISLTVEQMNYIVNLYSDTSYVVGLAIKHSAERKKLERQQILKVEVEDNGKYQSSFV
jgi:hypothetical protein